ncbi:hypothetical protein [Aliiroseovarius crassostreae]|uniref:hypothetical protein n=1 Tax=Aliiroseovarius crassostreae TaxID=154981 RepID=UPI0021FF3AC3|nr:hypothetical protein [Aliiroseovarius crassostreae]UWQ05975.1 hypothetical protein K3X22_05985 [Aliiroseovarius crassostreae]
MDFLEQVADELATDVLKVVDATGDESIITRIKKEVGISSTTLEEAFMTAVRVRRAEVRGRALLREIANDALSEREGPAEE